VVVVGMAGRGRRHRSALRRARFSPKLSPRTARRYSNSSTKAACFQPDFRSSAPDTWFYGTEGREFESLRARFAKPLLRQGFCRSGASNGLLASDGVRTEVQTCPCAKAQPCADRRRSPYDVCMVALGDNDNVPQGGFGC
jgi:hypothetical protein